MSEAEREIVVEDPAAPAGDSPAVTTSRIVDVVVSLLLLAFAALLAYDNWRTGAGFWGLAKEFLARKAAAETFVTRAQLRRVLQVFVPTLLFCFLMQWLGLYVASFLLIAGFMVFVGRLAVWKSLLTAFLFSLVMFVTFEIAFDVIMPKGPIESLFGR